MKESSLTLLPLLPDIAVCPLGDSANIREEKQIIKT
jgi:hypothetical protein